MTFCTPPSMVATRVRNALGFKEWTDPDVPLADTRCQASGCLACSERIYAVVGSLNGISIGAVINSAGGPCAIAFSAIFIAWCLLHIFSLLSLSLPAQWWLSVACPSNPFHHSRLLKDAKLPLQLGACPWLSAKYHLRDCTSASTIRRVFLMHLGSLKFRAERLDQFRFWIVRFLDMYSVEAHPKTLQGFFRVLS